MPLKGNLENTEMSRNNVQLETTTDNILMYFYLILFLSIAVSPFFFLPVHFSSRPNHNL